MIGEGLTPGIPTKQQNEGQQHDIPVNWRENSSAPGYLFFNVQDVAHVVVPPPPTGCMFDIPHIDQQLKIWEIPFKIKLNYNYGEKTLVASVKKMYYLQSISTSSLPIITPYKKIYLSLKYLSHSTL